MDKSGANQMKLLVTYPTTEKKWISRLMYQHLARKAELVPIRIFRLPCGSGAAASRYFYDGEFPAPSDAGFPGNGLIRASINRKLNPHFNPKKLEWDGNVAIV